MNALKKDKCTSFVSKKKKTDEQSEASGGLGKGGGRHPTPPQTQARLASLAEIFGSRRFFWLPVSLTAELGPRLKDLEPKLNTENQRG